MRNSETNKEMIYSGNWITDENETFVRFRGTLHATEELRHEIDCLNVFHVYTAFRHVGRLLEELDLVFCGVHVDDSMLPMPQSCVYLPRHLFSFLNTLRMISPFSLHEITTHATSRTTLGLVRHPTLKTSLLLTSPIPHFHHCMWFFFTNII